MTSIQAQFREKFNKSDALRALKELSQTMSTEEFISFSNTAMKTAYDKNRTKAVEYMLGFYPANNPQLLLRIHVQLMLSNGEKMAAGKKMFKVIIKHFSHELCNQIMDEFIGCQHVAARGEIENRKREINKIILEESIPVTTEHKTRRIKI